MAVHKILAKVLANSGSNKPVLLNVDYEGGHGGDITVLKDIKFKQNLRFCFWQLGHPNYQLKNIIK